MADYDSDSSNDDLDGNDMLTDVLLGYSTTADDNVSGHLGGHPVCVDVLLFTSAFELDDKNLIAPPSVPVVVRRVESAQWSIGQMQGMQHTHESHRRSRRHPPGPGL
jgi:hypothetical protein